MLNRRLYKGKLVDSAKFYADNFSTAERIALYWPQDCEVIDYYDTVSTANAAALAAKSGQLYPRIAINWQHPTFTFNMGHRDSNAAMPDWYDEDPQY